MVYILQLKFKLEINKTKLKSVCEKKKKRKMKIEKDEGQYLPAGSPLGGALSSEWIRAAIQQQDPFGD